MESVGELTARPSQPQHSLYCGLLHDHQFKWALTYWVAMTKGSQGTSTHCSHCRGECLTHAEVEPPEEEMCLLPCMP